AALRFAEHVLHVSEESLREHPGLEKYFGREIILGIRPSDFDDANFASHRGSTINVTANVTEELGSEINVIFAVDAPPVQHEATAALAAGAAGNGESDDAALPLAGENKTFFTARVNPRSSVRPGHPISLTVDTRRLHYFDPSSGLAIGHPANTAAGCEPAAGSSPTLRGVPCRGAPPACSPVRPQLSPAAPAFAPPTPATSTRPAPTPGRVYPSSARSPGQPAELRHARRPPRDSGRRPRTRCRRAARCRALPLMRRPASGVRSQQLPGRRCRALPLPSRTAGSARA